MFLPKKIYLFLVFNKSAYRSLLYIDIIIFVNTIYDLKMFYKPDIRPDIRQMKPDTRPDTEYQKGRISGYPEQPYTKKCLRCPANFGLLKFLFSSLLHLLSVLVLLHSRQCCGPGSGLDIQIFPFSLNMHGAKL